MNRNFFLSLVSVVFLLSLAACCRRQPNFSKVYQMESSLNVDSLVKVMASFNSCSSSLNSESVTKISESTTVTLSESGDTISKITERSSDFSTNSSRASDSSSESNFLELHSSLNKDSIDNSETVSLNSEERVGLPWYKRFLIWTGTAALACLFVYLIGFRIIAFFKNRWLN